MPMRQPGHGANDPRLPPRSQRQETQIVQPCKWLHGFQSGFRPQAIRVPHMANSST